MNPIVNASVGSPPEEFPPSWAGGWGEDDCGIYAEIRLAGVVITMRWIAPGTFLMGSPDDEPGRWKDECPQHRVTLTRGCWLAATPCTQAQWRAVMGTNPSDIKSELNPVENVSWDDSAAFCQKMNELALRATPARSVFVFRLPMEAEWEYACRAGTNTAFNNGSPCTEPEGTDPALDRLGWYGKNSGGKTHPVAELPPNAWGLYDMHGNVWEWCHDQWSDHYPSDEQVDPCGPDTLAGRVVRGGSAWSFAGYCRSACRDRGEPGSRSRDQGFRLASGQPVGSGAPPPEAAGAAASQG